MSEGWYCQILGQVLGPMSWADLARMAQVGELSADDFVYEEGTEAWRPASSQEGLFGSRDPLQDELGDFQIVGNSSSAPISKRPEEWYYQSLGVEFGPISRNDLHNLIREGQLDQNDPIRLGKNSGWSPLHKIPDLAGLLRQRDIPSAPITQEIPQPPPKQTKPLAANPKEEGEWYYRVQDTIEGPVDLQKLKFLALDQVLHRGCEVRRGTKGIWFPAESIPQISSLLTDAPQPAAHKPEPVSNFRDLQSTQEALVQNAPSPERVQQQWTPPPDKPSVPRKVKRSSGGGSWNFDPIASLFANPLKIGFLGVVGAGVVLYFMVPMIFGASYQRKAIAQIREVYKKVQDCKTRKDSAGANALIPEIKKIHDSVPSGMTGNRPTKTYIQRACKSLISMCEDLEAPASKSTGIEPYESERKAFEKFLQYSEKLLHMEGVDDSEGREE